MFESDNTSSAALAAALGVAVGLAASGVARGQEGGGGAPAPSTGPAASAAPSASASASGAPVEPGSAEAAPSGFAPAVLSAEQAPTETPVAEPSGSASTAPPPEPLAAPSPERDVARAQKEPKRAPIARIELGGSMSQGLDATDTASRGGGFYASGIYPVAKDFVFTGRYWLSSQHVVARLPGNRLGQFAVPNDYEVAELRHSVGFDVGYVGRLTGGSEKIWVMPLIGPRVAVFANHVATRWAFQADLALRAGVWVEDAFEAAAFIAYDPALAKARDLHDIYGSILSELRFGAGTYFRSKGPAGISVAYEGDLVTLEHQRISSHAILFGLSYALETK